MEKQEVYRRRLTLGPLLTLLLLCIRQPQHLRASEREVTLPRGCVLAVRYSSR